MNHRKITSHQPSQNIKDKKLLFNEYRQCYTCKLEFEGYWNLMNHRKSAHPSNKKCRFFPDGKCSFGKECWYVHAELLMEVDESFKSDNVIEDIKLKCNLCRNEFDSKDNLMRHKKVFHEAYVKTCVKLSVGVCTRSNDECWFNHTSKEEKLHPQPQKSSFKPQQVFQEASENLFPPDHLMKDMMVIVKKLCMQVETMEKRFSELMN